jgi:signal transduction histidine kinase
MVDVREVIDTAVNTVMAQLRKKELRLYFDIANELPPIAANRDALCQVFIHLLSNASEVSQSSGALTISAHTDVMREMDAGGEAHAEKFVHLTVKDLGGGISPEDRAHVFDPQYRADNPLIAGLGETGAGLAVAHTLVNAHGGRVWVESEMGVGSTFSVLLPLSGNGNAPEDDG